MCSGCRSARREDAQVARPTKRALVRFWRPFRIVAGFALLGVACWYIAGKSSELAGAGAFLTQLRWYWLVLAGIAELGSYLATAALDRTLLLAGQTSPRLGRLTLITFAGSAVQSVLPMGTAFAGVYNFRQFGLIGADEVLAGWVVIAAGAVAFAALAALAGIGLALAASTASTFDLVGAIIAVIFLAVVAVAAWHQRVRLYPLVTKAASSVERRLKRPAGTVTGPAEKGLERMRAVAPTSRQWSVAFAWGSASWLADCTCLVFAFAAVGTGVPWQGLLLAYCGAQLAVNLPITPGGLGVVEGSLTIALVAFGGGQAATVAVVLVYRVISFWVPIPIGAGCYAALARLRARALQHDPAVAPLAGAPGRATPAPGLLGLSKARSAGQPDVADRG